MYHQDDYPSDQIRAAAVRIRTEHPVDYDAKDSITNRQISEQNAACREQLDAWGVGYSATSNTGTLIHGRSIWHTIVATYTDGRPRKICGRWADNATEALLYSFLYAGWIDDAYAVVCFADPDSKIHEQMKREDRDAEKKAARIERADEKRRADIERYYHGSAPDPTGGLLDLL